jgi:hypothetical protein
MMGKMWGKSMAGVKEGKHKEKILTALGIKNATKPGKYPDGNGLYLVVDESGAKRWLLRIMVQHKRRDIGLGGLSLVSLAEAREKALEYRKLARAGGDPLAAKRAATRVIPTFKVAAESVHAEREGTWKNAKHGQQWINTLTTYAFPVIGDIRVDRIDTPDVLRVLSPIWTKKAETARRSRSPAAQPASNTELVDLLQTLIPQSDYLAFAVLVAFAGPLLEILGEPEGMIFHFCGESSTGKTTLAEVITAFTHQAHDRKLPPFNFTERGVEEIAYRANDSTFCMDEIGTMPPEQVAKIVRQVVYALANGGGKRRSGAAMVAEQFPQLDWRVICVLTGEIDIATTMLTAHSGTDARFIQINIPERTERGIFNVPATADTDEDAKFIDALKQACRLYTGDKFGEWVTYLADMPIQRRIRCRHLLDDYTRRLVGNDTDSLRSRRARKMATIAMTGRLLRDAKLFDWRKQFPITMVERIYRSETASHMSLSEDRAVRNWLGQILLDALGNDEELAQHRHPGKKVSVSPSSDPVRYIEIPKDDLPTYLGDLEMRGVTRWLDKMNCLARSKRTSVFYQKRLTIDGRTDSVPTLRMDLKRAVQLFYRRGQE